MLILYPKIVSFQTTLEVKNFFFAQTPWLSSQTQKTSRRLVSPSDGRKFKSYSRISFSTHFFSVNRKFGTIQIFPSIETHLMRCRIVRGIQEKYVKNQSKPENFHYPQNTRKIAVFGTFLIS